MTTTATTPMPDLAGFETHYGHRASTIGDDGDLVILGHVDDHTAIGVLNAHVRSLGFTSLHDWANNWAGTDHAGRLTREWARVKTPPATCEECVSEPPGAHAWHMDPVEADAEDAVPVTYWH